jgi:hypothetical protein
MYLWYLIHIYQGTVLKKASKRVRKKAKKQSEVSKWDDTSKRRKRMLYNVEVRVEDRWQAIQVIEANDIEDAYQAMLKLDKPMFDNKPVYYRVTPLRSR